MPPNTYLIRQIVRDEIDNRMRQDFWIDLLNEYQTKKTIERICEKISETKCNDIIGKNMDIYKKDIFSSLKYYSLYDPDLAIFRNKTIEEFNRVSNLELNAKIDSNINVKINDFLSVPVFEQIAKTNQEKLTKSLDEKINREIKPQIFMSNKYNWINLGLGIANTIGLVVVFMNMKQR